jgi:hypothetical protein
MPEICRFHGIVIRMYAPDHNPPHFHAYYAEHEAAVDIRRFALLTGWLPPRIRSMVLEWARLHESELVDNWERMSKDEQPFRIEPPP